MTPAFLFAIYVKCKSNVNTRFDQEMNTSTYKVATVEVEETE